jgi:hypothetical protein
MTSGIRPERTEDPQQARRLVREHGGAILTAQPRVDGESWAEYGQRLAAAVLGDEGVQVVTKFEASEVTRRASVADREARPAEDPRRRRMFPGPQQSLYPHNDGFAVGDEAPDQLFLLCAVPAAVGGESVLIDMYAELDAIVMDDPELAEFVFGEAVDQTEPGLVEVVAPLARRTASGRTQVRRNPYQAPRPGAPDGHRALLERWTARCDAAADAAPSFLLGPGELCCFDNYRMLHTRRPFDGDERTVYSIWGWTADTFGVLDMAVAHDV